MKVERTDAPRTGGSNKRRRRLIVPRLQLRLVAIFLGLSLLGLVFQALLVSAQLAQLGVAGVPSEVIPGLLWNTLLYSLLTVLPLTMAVGVLATFRIAGPVHRFEQHLAAIARGEDPGPCRIRAGDELQDLCDRINEAVAAVRARSRAGRALDADARAEQRSTFEPASLVRSGPGGIAVTSAGAVEAGSPGRGRDA